LSLLFQVQEPVETPPLNATATPPAPVEVVPGLVDTGAFLPILEYLSNPFVVAGLAVLIVVGLVVVIAVFRGLGLVGVHPYGRRVGSWLTSPGVDALVLTLDSDVREARLVPVKRVGSLYVGVEEPVYVVPVGGGESYVLAGTGKPVIVAVRAGRSGVQWIPAVDQLVNLSLEPFREERVSGAKDVERKLVNELVARQARVSGEVYVGPEIRLYISTNTAKALEALKREVAYATASALAAVHAAVQSVTEEGVKVLEAHRRLVETSRMTLIMGVVAVILIIAVVAVVLRMAGII